MLSSNVFQGVHKTFTVHGFFLLCQKKDVYKLTVFNLGLKKKSESLIKNGSTVLLLI